VDTSKLNCVCCGDGPPALTVEIPCGDLYCVDCLRRLFNKSTKDETLFPPRCHKKEIPPALVIEHLSEDEIARFTAAQEEFSTNDRIYCSKQSCSTFIFSRDIQAEAAKCKECDTITCTICKQQEHVGDCPEDTTVKETLALAVDNNWRRCGTCQRIVELSMGCYHITSVLFSPSFHSLHQ